MQQFSLNGKQVPIDEDDISPLVEKIRVEQRLTGTKLVCGSGVCGACTVLIDGAPAVSCLTPFIAVAGRAVTTIEGIAGDDLHPVQRAFMANDALQCGFCTPGFIVEATAFHDAWRKANDRRTPERAEIAAALAGHLCRCGAYDGIFRAVADACSGKFDSAAVSSPRLDARQKVIGAARYTVDVQLPGQLEGAIVRARIPHGRIVDIDLGPARAISGVTAVALAATGDVVRYNGAAVAAVAAPDRATAELARNAVKIVVTPLPAAVGMTAAEEDNAPRVYPGFFDRPVNSGEGTVMPSRWTGNRRGPSAAFSLKPKQAKADIAKARKAGDPLLVEGVWTTDAQCHTCLEPHAAVAHFHDDRLTVYLSTQAVSHMAGVIAKHVGMAADKVEVIAEHVGGGFGSKIGLFDEARAALALARAAKAPVRVAYDRHEELSVAGYRAGAQMRLAVLPKPSGGLSAISMSAAADSGVAVNSVIATLARLIYDADSKFLADYDVVNHLPPASPFRGPGGPVMAFALEQALDIVAEKLEVDPIAARLNWDRDPNRQRLYAWARLLPVWAERKPAGGDNGRLRRGVGFAAGAWLYFSQDDSEMELAVVGGKLVARSGVQDMGTGSRSVIATKLAEAFSLAPEDITIEIGRSSLPMGPVSGGSRTTPTIVPLAIAAAEKLKERLQQKTRTGDNRPWREIIAASSGVSVRVGRPPDSLVASPGIESPLKQLGMISSVFDFMLRRFSHVVTGRGSEGAVGIAEVEVDTWTGHTRLLRYFAGICVGKPQVPRLAESQVQGSIIQGLGYALYEGRQLDAATGGVLSANLEDYRIPGIADVPQMHIHFDEQGWDHVPGGGVGVGEVAGVPVAAAIANAVANATGVRQTALPMRPDRILSALVSRRTA